MHIFPRLQDLGPIAPFYRLGKSGLRSARAAGRSMCDHTLDHAALSSATSVIVSVIVRLGPGRHSSGWEAVSFILVMAAPVILVFGTLRLNRDNRP